MVHYFKIRDRDGELTYRFNAYHPDGSGKLLGSYSFDVGDYFNVDLGLVWVADSFEEYLAIPYENIKTKELYT